MNPRYEKGRLTAAFFVVQLETIRATSRRPYKPKICEF